MNITHLEISSSNLTDFGYENVFGNETLYSINLDNNNIADLNASLLKLPCLGKLSYENNNIEKINQFYVDALEKSNLTYLNLCSNVGIHESFCTSTTEELIREVKNHVMPETVPLPDQCYHMELINSQLLNTGDYSDFKITLDSKEFNVHKAILAASSSVFAAMFRCYMKESLEHRMKIDNHSAEAMQEFLAFIYTGKVPQDSDDNIMELFELSKIYDIEELKNYCTLKIAKNVNEKNAFDVFVLGNAYYCDELKEAAFVQIQKMLNNDYLDIELLTVEKINEIREAKKKLDELVENIEIE